MQAAIGYNPTTTDALQAAPVAVKKLSRTATDPQTRAAESAEYAHWTLHPPEDVRRLMGRAIREHGQNKAFWVSECIRAGLAVLAGKKDLPAKFIKPTSFRK